MKTKFVDVCLSSKVWELMSLSKWVHTEQSRCGNLVLSFSLNQASTFILKYLHLFTELWKCLLKWFFYIDLASYWQRRKIVLCFIHQSTVPLTCLRLSLERSRNICISHNYMIIFILVYSGCIYIAYKNLERFSRILEVWNLADTIYSYQYHSLLKTCKHLWTFFELFLPLLTIFMFLIYIKMFVFWNNSFYYYYLNFTTAYTFSFKLRQKLLLSVYSNIK